MQAFDSPFISYSVNREDVLLNRLFGSRDSGFFVDVGAAHPVFENDTKALSDRGWTGINIEPNVRFYHELAAQRPRDRNLNIAVSDQVGTITFHEVVGTGLSTCDPDEAKRAAKRGLQVITHKTEAQTLGQILKGASPMQIDLLKVDVEGFELKVLASNDWECFRPGLIMTEAMFPETPIRRPDSITLFLKERGYRHLYFDGLNDYYVEHGFIVPVNVFDRPPNVFDNFISYSHVLLDRSASLAAERAHALEIDLKRANQEITKLRREIAEISEIVGAAANAGTVPSVEQASQLASEIAALRASTSWRITRALRVALARPRRALKMLLARSAK